MKMKKNSLNIEIWKYFLLFSILILSILWTIQVLFFDKYYEYIKIQDARHVANIINNNKYKSNLKEIINEQSLEKEVCIEISDDGAIPLYSSTYRGKGCLIGNINSLFYKSDFINSNLNHKTYFVNNPNYDNDTFVYAIKLENNTYAFINTSIEAVESTATILTKQLIFITLIVLILSFIISYYISKHISKPIIDINNKAKLLIKNKNIKFNTNTNINELNELSETLNYANKELKRTDELRRDLMANVSHDLKTPLTMIKAYAEMATDLHSNNLDKQKQDMKIIIEETNRLSNLVADILTLSKMQSNMEVLNYEEFDLIDLINNILNRYSYLEELENYNFNFIHKNKQILIKADKQKLEQVIYNLINNAINYTGEDNTVTIKIINNQKSIKVEIIDTGKSFKKEEIPYIWDKYYKNKMKHKRNLIGTGLGLSIVKQILEAHKYEYGVIPIINKGTTFYFNIKKDIK